MKIGDNVQWQDGKKTLTGTIHGIRKAANENGTEKVVGYVVDTGNVEREEKRFNSKGKEIAPFIQPEFADLTPDQVTSV